jgi:hypothetical protein
MSRAMRAALLGLVDIAVITVLWCVRLWHEMRR